MIKNKFFDDLEIRSKDERVSDHLKKLNELIQKAKQNKNQSLRFNSQIKDLNDLSVIPLLRKSDLINKQTELPPFAELNVSKIEDFAHIYRSPGPIYDLDGHSKNWWRFARSLHAADFKHGDIVQNCFSYHFTPAGKTVHFKIFAASSNIAPAGVK